MPLLSSIGSGSVSAFRGAGGAAALYAFTSHTFTTAGLGGRFGPSLSQLQSAYAGQAWASNTAFFTQGRANGYQLWTVPKTGLYRIEAAGSNGQLSSNNPGQQPQGAKISVVVALTAGSKLEIVVGQQAGANGANGTYSFNSATSYAGAGGGTFVVVGGTTTPIVIAGGGGALYASWDGDQAHYNGQLWNVPQFTGTWAQGNLMPTAGQGGYGYHGGGGGGLLGSGQHYPPYPGSTSMSSATAGGQNFTLGAAFNGADLTGSGWGTWYATGGNATLPQAEGGFGGGGGGHSGNNSGGGGGGYTGGTSGSTTAGGTNLSGLGGGSFIISSGTNVITSNGTFNGSSVFNGQTIQTNSFNNGPGYVTITAL